MRSVLILVAGGSASGKTTVVNEIQAKLNSIEMTVLRHDDYYKDQHEMALEERKKSITIIQVP